MQTIQVDFERGTMLFYPGAGVVFALYRGTRNGWDAWLDVNDDAEANWRFHAPPELCIPNGIIGRVWRAHWLVDDVGFALGLAEQFDGQCERYGSRWAISDKLRRLLYLYEKDGVPTTWIWMGSMT